MKKDITKFPPSWCLDAVPSDRGWRHPRTGELLVSVRGGIQTESLIDETPEVEGVFDDEIDEDAIIGEDPVAEEVLPEPEPEEVIVEEAPKKKGRSKKND